MTHAARPQERVPDPPVCTTEVVEAMVPEGHLEASRIPAAHF